MESDQVFRWRKSSRSGGSGECVELGRAGGPRRPGSGAVRDSKNPGGPMLLTALPPLVDAVRGGRFDR